MFYQRENTKYQAIGLVSSDNLSILSTFKFSSFAAQIEFMALEGKVFLLKGTFTIPRKDLIEEIRLHGGDVAKTYNKQVRSDAMLVHHSMIGSLICHR